MPRTKKRKFPTKSQWRQFFKVLTKKEKIIFLIFFLLFLGSLIFLFFNFYFENTQIVSARGGKHIEGVIGQPRFINPVYANSDVDRDLVQLIFSGLMKYDGNLGIVPDLVQSYEISEDQKTYTFYLKEKLVWQDKTPLTADDVVFTIKTIQSPDFKSPLQKNWVGVEVEKISDFGIRFRLKKPYAAFLENCTVKILPKHIWQSVSPQNFPLEIYNLKPVGSGPYKLKEIKQEKQGKIRFLILTPNSLYYDKRPNISEIKFLFYNNEKELLKAARQGKIKGFSLSSLEKLNDNWQHYFFSFPRYFAVFFNQDKSKLLSEEEVRLALNYATDKKGIAEKVLGLPSSEKAVVHSPILPKIYGIEESTEIYEFDLEKAKEILEEAGFEEKDGLREKTIQKKPTFSFTKDLKVGSKGSEVEALQTCLAKFPEIYPEAEVTSYFGNKTKQAVIRFQEKYRKEILEPWGFTSGTGIVSRTTRKKLNEVCFEAPEEFLPLRFSLVTIDQPQLVEVAELLKEQWQRLGAEIEIKKYSSFRLEQDFIKPRNYEALLFGEALGAIPDPFPFWHSSQIRDPGLNLALYENKEADRLLEENREAPDFETRAEKLASFQDILIEETPALFLYTPDYIYFLSKQIKGIDVKKITDPSKRFSNIENWYIKTRRVLK